MDILLGSLSQSYSELSTNAIHIDHKYLLIFDSDVFAKGEGCGYQIEANTVLYFEYFF